MIALKTFEHSASLAELKVSYRRGRPGPASSFIGSPVSCKNYLRSVWDEDTIDLREEFLVLCLTGGHEVLGWVKLHTGGFGHAAVDPRLVLGVALQTASSAVVIAHNHPSGRLTPSPEDSALTRRIAAGCEIVGLKLLDHVIVSREDCHSFAENGGW